MEQWDKSLLCQLYRREQGEEIKEWDKKDWKVVKLEIYLLLSKICYDLDRNFIECCVRVKIFFFCGFFGNLG